MTTVADPTVAWAGADDPSRPLVVLLHGRGSDEAAIIGITAHLPATASYAAVRAPIAEGGGMRGSPTGVSAGPWPARSPRR